MSYHSNNPVYKQIADRFLRFRPQIKIGEYIRSMSDIGRTVSEGITFVPSRPHLLRSAIAFTRVQQGPAGLLAFQWDNRKNWVHRLAALATKGEGYREIGSPSLHCALSSEECNIHIDEFGFVARGPNGGVYYTPEALRHTFDELIWRAGLRPLVMKGLGRGLPKFLAAPALKLLDQTYLVIPGSETRYGFDPFNNRFQPRVGAGIKLLDRKQVKLRLEHTCGNLNCSDNRTMLKLSIDLDQFGISGGKR